MHDASKVLLGVTNSNFKEVSCEDGNPATFAAGLAVRRATTGGLQLASDSVAALIGISLGQDLSAGAGKTAVCRRGYLVPIRLKLVAASLVVGDLTFTAVKKGTVGNAITIALLDETTDGSANVEVDGTDIVINMEDGVTTADAIAAAIEGSEAASALVTVAVAGGQGSTAQQDAAETSLAGGDDIAAKGEAVVIDNTSGEGAASGTTTTAVYMSGLMTGVDISGNIFDVALVSMPGGL